MSGTKGREGPEVISQRWSRYRPTSLFIAMVIAWFAVGVSAPPASHASDQAEMYMQMLIKSRSEYDRHMYADLLTSLADEAFPVLINALVTGDDELRADVAYVFANMNDPYLLEWLGKDGDLLIQSIYEDPFWRVRANAAHALISAQPTPEIISALHHATFDTDERVRTSALYAIRLTVTSRSDMDTMVPVYIEALHSDSPAARVQALLALRKFGAITKVDVKTIGLLLQDEDPSVRKEAAGSLAQFGGAVAEIVPNLTIALVDPNESIRFAALQALGRTREAGRPALIAALAYSSLAPRVIDELSRASGSLTAELGIALAEGSEQVRIGAAQVLAARWHEREAAIPLLAEALNDPSPMVRRAVAISLGLLCPCDQEIMEHIEEVKASDA